MTKLPPDKLPRPALVPVSIALLFTFSCAHKAIVSSPSTPVQTDNSYMDLTPGSRLRIVVPLLTSGGYLVATHAVQKDDNTFVLSAANLTGYQVSYYAITGRSDREVRLVFTSADTTKEGKTIQDSAAPTLPFALPPGPRHVRLIYFVRKSQSDHNMAIVASRNLEKLNVFTKQLEANPEVCHTDIEIFCAWVPAGIAVRPEPGP